MHGTYVGPRCSTYSYGYLMISLGVLKKDALFFKSRPVGAGEPRVPGCVWRADELTLFEPGGRI